MARPRLPEILVILSVIAALQLFNLLTHDDVLTAVLTFLVCGGYIAWFFWSNRYR